MGYHKIINLLDNAPIQPTRFRKKNWVKWVEINDDAREMHNTNSKI